MSLQTFRRSKFEDKIELQLKKDGIRYTYEEHKFQYMVPSRPATYTPDFKIGTSIFIEAKGSFNIRGRSADERKKLLLVRKMNPELDLRIIFQNASRPIYKGAKTTHGQWAEVNGFLWADKGIIPEQWLIEGKKQIILKGVSND